MCAVDRLLLTHSHLDHIAALPLMLDATGSRRKAPLDVYALSATIGALKEHIFNGVIWPDFTRIPSEEWPLIRLHEIFAGQILQLGDKVVEVLPAVHAVPAAGFAVTSGRGSWVYSGDTGSTPAFWSRLNQLDVAMLVFETAFSNRKQELAEHGPHLAPALLAEETPGYLVSLQPGSMDIKARWEYADTSELITSPIFVPRGEGADDDYAGAHPGGHDGYVVQPVLSDDGFRIDLFDAAGVGNGPIASLMGTKKECVPLMLHSAWMPTVDELADADRLRFSDELTEDRLASLDDDQRRVVERVAAEIDG